MWIVELHRCLLDHQGRVVIHFRLLVSLSHLVRFRKVPVLTPVNEEWILHSECQDALYFHCIIFLV